MEPYPRVYVSRAFTTVKTPNSVAALGRAAGEAILKSAFEGPMSHSQLELVLADIQERDQLRAMADESNRRGMVTPRGRTVAKLTASAERRRPR